MKSAVELFVNSPCPPEEVIESRTRTVLMYDGVVVKIPRNDEGVLANSMELRTYLDPEGIPVAPVMSFDLDGLNVNVMERVSPHPYAFQDKGLPWWVGCVDCGQVGYRDNGELVAYDL